MPYFGQELFERAQAKGSLDDKEYKERLATRRDGWQARKGSMRH